MAAANLTLCRALWSCVVESQKGTFFCLCDEEVIAASYLDECREFCYTVYHYGRSR